MTNLLPLFQNTILTYFSPPNSLGHHSYDSLLVDDYSVNQHKFKAKASTLTGGILNFKVAYDYVKDQQTQEIQIQLPYKDLNFWAGIRPQDYKFHVDFGEYSLVRKLRYYANLKRFEHGLDSYRFGAVHNGLKCQSNTRIEHTNNEFSVSEKLYVKENDIALGFVGTYNLSQNVPTKYDFLVGYLQPNFDLFLRHYSTNERQLRLGRILGNIVLRQNNQHTFGVEVELDDNQNTSVTAGAAALVSGYILKAKTNLMQQNVFFSVKGSIDDRWLLTVSGQLPFGINYRNTTKLPFPLGLTLETTL